MKIKIVSLLALSLSVLSGCNLYKPPQTGPLAKVRLVSVNSGFYTQTSIHGPEICKNRARLGMLGDIGYMDQSRSIGMIGGDEILELNKVEYPIAASQPSYFSFGSMSPIGSNWSVNNCYITVGFTPEPNKQYELSIKRTSEECEVFANLLSQTKDGTIKRTPVTEVTQHDLCE